MISRLLKLGAVVVLSTLAGAGVAGAATGTFVRSPGKVVFSYGKSGGNADGGRKTGLYDARLCGDVFNSKARVMFVGEFRQDKPFFPDYTLDRISAYYSDPATRSDSWALSTSSKYYPVATWNYYGGDGSRTGYVSLC